MYDFAAARSRYNHLPNTSQRRAGVDFETTGTNLRYDDRPFSMSLTYDNGETLYWEVDVDPFTRMPTWSKEYQDEIRAVLSQPDVEYVMSNKKFDIQCVRHVLPDFDIDAFFKKCHDTIGMHHCLHNGESHALKDAAAKHGGIADSDEKDLKVATKAARKIAEGWGWKIASLKACPLLHRRPQKGFEVMDYWVPRQVAQEMWCSSAAGKQYLMVRSSGPGYAAQAVTEAKALEGWEWRPPSEDYSGHHPWYTVAGHYNRLDTLRSVHLFRIFKEQLIAENLWEIYQEFLISSYMTFIIEEPGLEFNYRLAKKALPRYVELAEDAKEAVSYSISPLYRINPDSPDQVRRQIYGPSGFGMPVTRRTVNKKNRDATGQPTIDKDFLSDIIGKCAPDDPALLAAPRWVRGVTSYDEYQEQLYKWHYDISAGSWTKNRGRVNQLYAFCASILMYKKSNINARQVRSFIKRARYLDEATGFATLFHNLNPWGTGTTRLSGSDPNPQNISKGGKSKKSVAQLFKDKQTLRVLFGPPPGREWWNCDYTQLQLVIFAFMCKSARLIELVLSGQDFHDAMARIIFDLPTDPAHPDFIRLAPTDDQRGIAKNVNFGFLFGAQAAKIEQTAGMPGLYAILENRLPEAIDFLEKMEWEVRHRGYVRTMGGYKLYVPEETPYAGSVYAIQGTEGEISKRATYGCQDYLDRRVPNRRDMYITLPLHDELDFSSNRGFGERHIGSLCTIMEDAAESYGVQVKVSPKYCAESWASGVVWEFDDAPGVLSA